jgi:hypothetical protein
MYGQHDLGSLIRQRNEEALQEARTRYLAKQAQSNRRPRSSWPRINPAWGTVLSLLRGADLSE